MLRVGCLSIPAAFLLLLSTSGNVSAQPDEPQSGGPATGLIVGQVVDAGSGRPVANAIVQLNGAALRAAADDIPAGIGTAPPGLRVMTTAEGRFFFRSLRKGNYTIRVTRHGYLPGSYGARSPAGAPQTIDLDEGERVADASVTLWRYGTISGTVLDEAGEPVVGLQVRAFHRTTVAGRRRFLGFTTGTTDDRGSYRIPGLIPGDYLVGIVPTQVSVPTAATEQYRREMETRPLNSPLPPSATALIEIGASLSLAGTPMGLEVGNQTMVFSRGPIPPPQAEDGRMFVYPSTFYPAALSISLAAIVTVGSGEERSAIDMQLKPVRTASVFGLVVGPDGPASGIPLRLVPAGSEEMPAPVEAAATVSAGDGGFTFIAVPQGQYTLRVVKVPRPAIPQSTMTMVQSGSGMTIGFSGGASPATLPPVPAEPTLWAEVPVAVGASDVTDVNVVLRRGIVVSGRMDFEGGSPRPTADQMARITVRLQPVEPSQAPSPVLYGRVEGNGEFRTIGVAPGRYFIDAGATSPWMFKSATYEGRDSADVPLKLETSDATNVVIAFTDRPSELSGTVQKNAGGADGDAAVLIFPADSQTWTSGTVNPRRMRSTRTGRSGNFRFLGLPAGDYYVAAIPGDVANDWQDAKYLEAVSQFAVQVRIDDGQKKTQDLKTRQQP